MDSEFGNITTKEKAKMIGMEWYNAKCCGVPMDSHRVAEQAALQMAEWKEEQMTKNAIDFLVRILPCTDGFIEEFKSAMKGE